VTDDPSQVQTVIGTLLAGFLALLGWHGRKVSDDVGGLLDRTARLEATAVKLEDIRKVLREEVGINLKESDRRVGKLEESVDALSNKITELQCTLPRRANDVPHQG